ncbi:MAG: GntR family transcriptional regulator [Microbacteriaceae bacterium]|nr:MAG: GntR family transcriptional regulator [Microbacteriaceae bacterium]
MLSIDHGSAIPPFEQLRMQIIEAVRSGELAAGARLPTVRKLADDLGLAANTVARSYRRLEQDEVIETRGRQGSFIAATGDATHRQAQLAASAFALRMSELGIPVNEATEIVTAALRHTRGPEVRSDRS